MRYSALNLILMLALVSSCTIQKRLYQPGWSISFKGNWKKSQATQASDEVHLRVEQDTVKNLEDLVQNNELPIHETATFENNQFEAPVLENFIQKNPTITSFSKKVHLAKSSVASKAFFSKDKLASYNPSREINLVGLIFLVIGLIIVAFGLLIYIPALASSTAFFGVLFGMLIIIFGGIIGLIGLIILLAGLLTDAVIKNEERLRTQQPTSTVNNESLEPETQNPKKVEPIPYVKEQEQESNKAKNWLIIGGFIAAFSAIFLIISNK